eukprot:1633814-Pleurochrysis_carterae.AAC.6
MSPLNIIIEGYSACVGADCLGTHFSCTAHDVVASTSAAKFDTRPGRRGAGGAFAVDLSGGPFSYSTHSDNYLNCTLTGQPYVAGPCAQLYLALDLNQTDSGVATGMVSREVGQTRNHDWLRPSAARWRGQEAGEGALDSRATLAERALGTNCSGGATSARAAGVALEQPVGVALAQADAGRQGAGGETEVPGRRG